jgi:tetratricopeptide (TPR) repeat protein
MMNDPRIEPHKIVIIMDSIASHLVEQSEYENTLDINQRSLAKKQTYLPNTHPDLASSYNDIATCLFQLKRFEEALVYAQKAVDIAHRFLPAQSSHTLDYEKNLRRIQVHCYH